MTDAEKMREAAAQVVRDALVGNPRHDAARHIAVAAIRALPTPDASAPAADRQQAGLVTVDAAQNVQNAQNVHSSGAVEVCGICDITGCYHIRERNGMPSTMQTFTSANASDGPRFTTVENGREITISRNEIRSVTYDSAKKEIATGLLDEVKAARISDVDMAMLQSMATSFRARMGFSFNPDDMADLLTRVSAALARLEREVG